mmetsp:Transcript_15669/g.25752  ORF Transcript_15669/g.25752 Transcript_15669/m.25752 type:complete len:694 (-) Transcript_15669:60-2141(-)|eukprot:scaffold1953_cov146-Skeletonema_menzelii.AAC.10
MTDPTSPVAAEDEAAKKTAAAEENSTDDAETEATAGEEPTATGEEVATETTVANEPSNEATDTTSNEDRMKSIAGIPIYCSCRKSQCIKLYCGCFDAGIDCAAECTCKKCKNNPKARLEADKAEAAAKKERQRKMDLIAAAKEEATMLLIVSPGRLGLTLKIDKVLGGATITEIDAACTFKGQLEVGDRIVTIDGVKVTKVSDLQVNKDKIRKFGIAKTKTLENMSEQAKKDLKEMIPEKMKPDKSTNFYEIKPYVRDRRQTFPFLSELKASGMDRTSQLKRGDMMTELLQFDKRNNIETKAKMGAYEYQILCVPLSRRESVNKRELDNKAFHSYNKQTKLMDKFIDSWAQWCDGTRDDAANMILFHMAKKFPSSYVQNFEMATKKHEKAVGPPPVDLPPDFVSYDGTNDIKWNAKYAELLKYHEKHGNCMVYTKTDLGRWVCMQRTQYQNKAKSLTEKRVELLEQLDFRWRGVPDHWQRATPGGNPRQCRALAAKLVYPGFSIRECLLLAGFTNEELDAVKDPKHTWRTGYVYYKDMVVKKLKDWDTAQRRGARIQTEQLIGILEGDDPDKFEQVFGENAVLLPEFLKNAEERERNGTSPDKTRGRAKRSYNDSTDNDIHQQNQEYMANKMPRIETVGMDYSAHNYPPQHQLHQQQQQYHHQGYPQNNEMAAHQMNSWRAPDQNQHWQGHGI